MVHLLLGFQVTVLWLVLQVAVDLGGKWADPQVKGENERKAVNKLHDELAITTSANAGSENAPRLNLVPHMQDSTTLPSHKLSVK